MTPAFLYGQHLLYCACRGGSRTSRRIRCANLQRGLGGGCATLYVSRGVGPTETKNFPPCTRIRGRARTVSDPHANPLLLPLCKWEVMLTSAWNAVVICDVNTKSYEPPPSPHLTLFLESSHHVLC